MDSSSISSETNFNSKKQKPNSLRIWPLLYLPFIRALYTAIYQNALPNYLIFIKDFNPKLMGIITSVGFFSSIFGPMIGTYCIKKIGMKKTILLISILPSFIIAFQILFMNPIIIIVLQLIDGILMGIFWPLILTQFSVLQNIQTKSEADKNFRNFTTSFNVGFLVGFVVGFGLVSIWKSELLALIISMLLALLLIPGAFMVDDRLSTFGHKDITPHRKTETAQTQAKRLTHLIFPLIPPLLGMLQKSLKMRSSPFSSIVL
jgi:MFS family permease